MFNLSKFDLQLALFLSNPYRKYEFEFLNNDFVVIKTR